MAYRVYASHEKGFSVSDRPYKVTVGESEKMPSEFPANFVVETSATELEVVGAHLKLKGANKAFYRVVAVDAAGNRSGPSDYAAAPRPVIVSAPVTRATSGVAYRYPVEVIRSMGDLRTRVVNGKETMKFWDVERLRFEIQRGPRLWLTIDEATGLLSGEARSTGHDRAGCRRDARARHAPSGRRGRSSGESREVMATLGVETVGSCHSELHHRGASVARPRGRSGAGVIRETSNPIPRVESMTMNRKGAAYVLCVLFAINAINFFRSPDRRRG